MMMVTEDKEEEEIEITIEEKIEITEVTETTEITEIIETIETTEVKETIDKTTETEIKRIDVLNEF